ALINLSERYNPTIYLHSRVSVKVSQHKRESPAWLGNNTLLEFSIRQHLIRRRGVQTRECRNQLFRNKLRWTSYLKWVRTPDTCGKSLQEKATFFHFLERFRPLPRRIIR